MREIRIKNRLRVSITLRLLLLLTAAVPGTAALMYFGMEYGSSRIRNVERDARMHFLATSIAFAVRNYVVMGGDKIISDVVAEALNKNIGPELIVTKVAVTGASGQTIYTYDDPPPGPRKVNNISAPIENEEQGVKTVLGNVRLEYYSRDPAEYEKTHQIITIGNTLAAMFQVFYRNKALFQAKELMDTVRNDRNVLYCYINGEKGRTHFSYRRVRAGDVRSMTRHGQEQSLSVNHARPISIQDIAAPPRYGKVIEVAILIEQDNQKLGVVRIGYSLKSWLERVQRQRLYMSLTISGLMALSLALSLLLSRGVSSPIVKLTRVARESAGFSTGGEIDFTDAERDVDRIASSFENIASRLKRRNDEIGDLADSFSSLLSELKRRVGELRHFYAKVNQADRLFAMGQLAAGIAHEINNPLAIISTYVQIIGKRSDIDDEVKKEIGIIYEEINRIAEKVSDLMNFAQEGELKSERGDLNELVSRTLKMMRHQFSKKSIAVVEDYAPGELLVDVDRNKIRQVMLNLLINALQSMESGTLTVKTARAEDGCASVRVTDTGCGISPEDMPRIFDPFFTKRKVGEGTGLGLAISYSIMQSHGGTIEVESEPGKGASFIVKLPCAKSTTEVS